jgi:glycosyltransferase involved in cell wall biosynthesis
MNYVLVTHHDAELYGADKSLIRTLRALRLGGIHPILALPLDGPLVPLLRAEGVEVHIGPIGKLTRRFMKPLALPFVAWDMLASLRFISHIVAGRRVDLAYANSVAVLGGAIWALLHRIPRLWHVREIVVVPPVAARGFPLILRLLGGWCVCNSHATRDWITDEQKALGPRSSVVWNGLEELVVPPAAAVAAFRAKLGVLPQHTLVTLVGRINRWKGQGVLIEAAALLKQQGKRDVRYLILGDVADGQHRFREDMMAQIQSAGLQGEVVWHPFMPDVDVAWAASDIAVVPSTEPEPFGRVAIEAMSHGLPVLASNGGGLAEIVDHEKSGLLVTPGSAGQLASAIARLVDAPGLRKTWGDAGRQRQLALFSQQEHDRKLLALMGQLARQ